MGPACSPALAIALVSSVFCNALCAAGPAGSSDVDVRLELVVDASAARDAVARLSVGSRAQPKTLHVDVSPGGVRLVSEQGRKETELWRGQAKISSGTHVLILKKRRTRVALCLDAERLAEVTFDLPGRLRLQFQPAPGTRPRGKPRIQKVAPIHFTDDFARAGEGAALWDTVSGRFAVNASTTPQSAQSPFQFWGRAAGRGVAVAANSYWFWDDYRVDVSAKSTRLPAAWGLVFYYVDPDNYHALRWSQPAHDPGRIELIRRRAGKESVLATREHWMRPDQWYRLVAVTCGARVQAFLGGVRVLEATDPSLAGGRVGLLVEDASNVYFDDVAVGSVGADVNQRGYRLPEPFGPGEKEWSDFSRKRFARDSHMRSWSSPRSFWERGGAGSRGLRWFRTRVFHDVRFRWNPGNAYVRTNWPRRPVEVVLFGDRENPQAGYHFRLNRNRVTLTRDDKTLARNVVNINSLRSLECAASPAGIQLRINRAVVLKAVDPKPLMQGEVAADIGRTFGSSRWRSDWRDEAIVLSSHRLDYAFDDAPTAWEVQSGRWRATHRWACVPRWSFFGGRGTTGLASDTDDSAVLWNRRRFRGDFDFEVFFAPMEGSPQRVHFTWPIALNVAFAADGRNLDSGYMLLFGTFDLPTQLYRAGRVVASWRGGLDPGLRRRPMPLYHRMTQGWQHVRVQRRGGRIQVAVGESDDYAQYLGLRKVLEYEDPHPLEGGRLGLWTWGANGMAVARAIISFADSPGPAALPADLPMSSPCENVYVESLPGSGGEPKRFLRIHNRAPGGAFSHELAAGPIDLERTGTVEFDYRLKPDRAATGDLHLGLFARVRGQMGQVILSGPTAYSAAAIPLGRFHEGEGGQNSDERGSWRHARFDLLGAFRRAFPEGSLVAEGLWVASPFESIPEIAGLGVNRQGAAYDLANVRLVPSPASPGPGRSAAPRIVVDGVAPMDDFEAGLGQWRRLGGWGGAALYRDLRRPCTGRYSLRLLNEELGGPAGAWACTAGYDLARFPLISFDYRFSRGVELNLLARVAGHWYEVRATGTDATWPVIGQLQRFTADGEWRHAEFDLCAALRGTLRRGDIRIEALAFADSGRMSTWQGATYWIDNFCRVPAADPDGQTTFHFQWDDKARPVAFSHVFDDKPDTAPPGTSTGRGDRLAVKGAPAGRFLHVRVQDAKGTWSDPAHLQIVARKASAGPPRTRAPAAPAAQRGAPAAPYVSYIPSDRLCRTAFEWQKSPHWPEKQLDEFRIRRQVWVLPCSDDAATGEGCVEMLNVSPREFFSVYFRKSPYDPARWPRIAFDYKFEQPGCALNFSLLVNGAMTIVEWTGPNARGNYFYSSVIGRTEPARQDGKWHHVDFDLLDMILKKRFPDPARRAEITVSELATWATNHWGRRGGYVNPRYARLKIDNFTMYAPGGRDPAFEWRVHGASARMKGYSCVFDANPVTVPRKKINATDAKADFKNVKPGKWYFHVRACGPNGRWGPAAHRAVVIR